MSGFSGGAAATHEGMGTAIEHQAHGEWAREALKAARLEAARLERLLSRFQPESDVGRINRAAGGKPVPVAPETMRVLTRAAVFSRLTGGCFDCTVAPLSDLWDFRRAVVPGAEAIARVRALANWRDLELDGERSTAQLKRPGQAIDLGGIAKGFAGDRMMELFRQYGIRSALSNFGGGVSALGARPDGGPWRVGIRHPRREGLVGALSVEDSAVVTSGDYERCFFAEGRRCHHLIDPRTGQPAASGLVSVTVVSSSALTADALSTAAFVAGMERGLEWVRRCGAEAVMIDEGLNMFVTRGLQAQFEGADGFRAILV